MLINTRSVLLSRIRWSVSISKCCVAVIQIQADSVVSDTNRFINFWLRFFDTGRGTQLWKFYANHTMLYPLCWRAAHLVMFKISVGRDPKNPTTSFNGRKVSSRPQWSNLNFSVSMVQFQLTLFKILKFSLLGMTSSTLQPHFLSGGLLWQWWLSYLLRASVNRTNWLCT